MILSLLVFSRGVRLTSFAETQKQSQTPAGAPKKQVCFDVNDVEDITPLQWVLGLAISVAAATLAYRCSPPNTGTAAKTLFAFFFSEIYLAQAALRAIVGDWTCTGPSCAPSPY